MQNIDKHSTVLLQNDTSSMTLEAFGGAITEFRLKNSAVNPLSFRIPEDRMPENNKSGAPFRGHFLCLGRWGPPSAGEERARVPYHGHFANMMWDCETLRQRTLKMIGESDLEGLKLVRTLELDNHSPLYLVTEKVKNTNPLGRLYNMVQHPTLAAPFLNHNTRIQSNASVGFHYQHYLEPEKHKSKWPYGIEANMAITDLRCCNEGDSSVFSFIVLDTAQFGWITAHSPDSRLIIGYLWKRQDYSWINLWKDWDKKRIRHCGLEFGTTGIHQPFPEILKQGRGTVFNAETFKYIDAGDEISRSYLSFLVETPVGFDEVESVYTRNETLFISQGQNGIPLELKSQLIGAISQSKIAAT